MRPVPHLILSFPPRICKSHTLHRNGTTATLNVFLLSPLDSICLDVIRAAGGLGTILVKNTKVKTGAHKNHGPITTSSVTENLPTHKLTFDSTSLKNIDPYTTPTTAAFVFGIRAVDVEINGDNDRTSTAKVCANVCFVGCILVAFASFGCVNLPIGMGRRSWSASPAPLQHPPLRQESTAAEEKTSFFFKLLTPTHPSLFLLRTLYPYLSPTFFLI